MDEILKKLLKSELLSEESRAEISEQWTTSVATFKSQVREEVATEVRLELAEQWINERDELVRKVDDYVSEALKNEMSELKADVERFRDLEIEYAERIVEEKQNLAEEVASELDDLVEKIDAFFEVRLNSELDELKEDLELVKQNNFGRKIYEAFAEQFAEVSDEESVQSQLVVAEAKLRDVEHQVKRLSEDKTKMVREAKMEQILAPLTGKKRDQMSMVLRSVETNKLEESYKLFIGRILKEGEGSPTALTESAPTNKTHLVTGEPAVSGQKSPQLDENIAEFRRIAGLK